jgi:hypothetical protein
VSLALGLMSTRGRSETSVALELGVCRAAVSKSVIQVLKCTGLEDSPAWGLKSPENREVFKRTNGRRRLDENERLGDIALSEPPDSTAEYRGTDVILSAQ